MTVRLYDLYYRSSAIVIYDHNDSTMYYKSSTIVIYDHNDSTIVWPVL
jgi:hypothetical protein